jgi:hypothetical protein
MDGVYDTLWVDRCNHQHGNELEDVHDYDENNCTGQYSVMSMIHRCEPHQRKSEARRERRLSTRGLVSAAHWRCKSSRFGV